MIVERLYWLTHSKHDRVGLFRFCFGLTLCCPLSSVWFASVPFAGPFDVVKLGYGSSPPAFRSGELDESCVSSIEHDMNPGIRVLPWE